MSPASVAGEDQAMTDADNNPRKRVSPDISVPPPGKRPRTLSSRSSHTIQSDGTTPKATQTPTTAELSRAGLRRAISLALDHVGFDAASEEAMESFSAIVETCKTALPDLTSVIEDVKTFANSARRSHPIPTDFDLTLRRFNITPESLRKHVRPPIPKERRIPTWEPVHVEQQIDVSLPVLGPELSGEAEKESKQHIPSIFPSFPSIHTYKSTPQVREYSPPKDDWLQFSSQSTQSLTLHGDSQTQSQRSSQLLHRPLAADEIPRGDPKKMREAAAKEAKLGEEALRRLLRASKIAKQKEVWSIAQKEPPRKLRYELWESTMRNLLEEDARTKGKELDFATAAPVSTAGRFEIADHSTIVNAETVYHRKEVQRTSNRKAVSG